MATKIMILNGPNLNFLGIREPHIYGSTTLEEIEASCQELATYLGISISFHQSNLEGELVNLIQSAHGTADAIIMNPAAYSFTSIALIDALKIFEGPKKNVITNGDGAYCLECYGRDIGNDERNEKPFYNSARSALDLAFFEHGIRGLAERLRR